MDNSGNQFDDALQRRGDELGHETDDFDANVVEARSGVEADVHEGQSLIDEAKEMARRDWENQYEEAGSSSDSTLGSAGDLGNADSELGGMFDDAQSEVDNEVGGQRSSYGGTVADPTSDVDSQIANKQAGLGGAIGSFSNSLGNTFGDDQLDAGGAFNDIRGGGELGGNAAADLSGAGLVSNDLQGAVGTTSSGEQAGFAGSYDNVESTLSGGLGDEQSGTGSKFDSVRSEVERNFSDVSGTVDSGTSGAFTGDTVASGAGYTSHTDTDAFPADSGDLQFSNSGVVDDAGTQGNDHHDTAHGMGDRAHGAGMSLKQRAAEAREQASDRFEDAKQQFGGGNNKSEGDGKSMVEDVQEKAKGLFNKVKDAFDGNKKN